MDLNNKSDQEFDFNIVLVGQPNCGKSTIFNEVAGYRSISSNFPGATIQYTKSRVRVGGEVCALVDLPGIYSLSSFDEAERVSQQYLINGPVDVIVNVIDASLLGRSLELTLQLLDLKIPMVVCLNMIDEAEKKGIFIDTSELSKKLGVVVVTTVASRGRGIDNLFKSVVETAEKGTTGNIIKNSRDVEIIIAKLAGILKDSLDSSLPFLGRLLAVKLLENDPFFVDYINQSHPELTKAIEDFQKELSRTHGRPSDAVMNGERHALSLTLFEEVTRLGKPKKDWRKSVDKVLMHNVWGYFFLVLFLFIFFNTIFRFGALIEAPMMALVEQGVKETARMFGSGSMAAMVSGAVINGFGGGLAIILPYLFPFLFGLALLEDIGYLPRVAFLMDAFMHKIGLHGKAVIPAVIGYGCNVPAIMATRILESPRDRFIASLIAAMVPCAARMTIIMGLVGFYLGGTAAMLIYLLNLIVISISGRVLSKLLPEVTPGMLLEIPQYQIPRIETLLQKTWLRLKEFIFIAWPLLVGGSIILGFIEYFNFSMLINKMLSPITWILGLPSQTGITLIFGVFKKELSMLMLFQAMGTRDLLTVMTYGQILVFTVFIVFYVPCVATIGALYKAIGSKRMILITVFTFILALVIGFLTRVLTWVVW
ncbi:ferrous iron transport protein B [bacterium]|nr:ferrous iron transport protein B [bacterium]